MSSRHASLFCLLAICSLVSPCLAGLEFDQTHRQLKAAPGAKSVTALFSFINRGSDIVTISQVDPDCSCLAVQVQDGKLSYAPGEAGMIRAEFEIGNAWGTVHQQVDLWLQGDAGDKPSFTLKVSIEVTRLITMTPRSLKWHLGDEKSAKTIHILVDHDQPIQVTSVSSTKRDFQTKLRTIKPGTEYAVEVTPQDTATPGMAVIRIETDSPIEMERIQQSFAMVLRTAASKASQAQP